MHYSCIESAPQKQRENYCGIDFPAMCSSKQKYATKHNQETQISRALDPQFSAVPSGCGEFDSDIIVIMRRFPGRAVVLSSLRMF